MTVQDILSNSGTDMSPWPTSRHFAPWLRFSPNNKVTGGKVKQHGTYPLKIVVIRPSGLLSKDWLAAIVPGEPFVAESVPGTEVQKR